MTLKEACDMAIISPHFQTIHDGTGKLVTFCNMGARFIAHSQGCLEFDDPRLTAEDMGRIMDENRSGHWLMVEGQTAALHAKSGGLGFAFMSAEKLGEEHAHIAAIYPAPMELSPSLGKEVPIVANIGVKDVAEKESAAFPVSKGEPDYYIWTQEV